MKRLVLATMSVSALFASAVYAAPQSIQISGNVDPVCAVTGLHSSTSLHVGPVGSGNSGTVNAITVTCNYYSGADVTLTSTNQGLKSTDPSSPVILNYTASLDMAGDPVTLDTSSATFVTKGYGGGGATALAAGITSDLSVNVPTGTVFSGDYTDTLTITIAQQ
ncbi:hypothetical protein [Enterovibrio coralii]|uniref:Spore coat protein U domain-containing protein n=1 Tax=Enterovibrio coralii TaxID=294935 RepID=A0A135I6N2_9GAMM|nr:hypothetical protein [Enterovibrio coralii]KXF81111.1 hypothetical protein ATN88_19335 [Enterovibrio coralii]